MSPYSFIFFAPQEIRFPLLYLEMPERNIAYVHQATSIFLVNLTVGLPGPFVQCQSLLVHADGSLTYSNIPICKANQVEHSPLRTEHALSFLKEVTAGMALSTYSERDILCRSLPGC